MRKLHENIACCFSWYFSASRSTSKKQWKVCYSKCIQQCQSYLLSSSSVMCCVLPSLLNSYTIGSRGVFIKWKKLKTFSLYQEQCFDHMSIIYFIFLWCTPNARWSMYLWHGKYSGNSMWQSSHKASWEGWKPVLAVSEGQSLKAQGGGRRYLAGEPGALEP